MESGNSITSENLITVEELINNWQIASISKKKKKKKIVWKIQVNPTRPNSPVLPRLSIGLSHLRLTWGVVGDVVACASVFLFCFVFVFVSEYVLIRVESDRISWSKLTDLGHTSWFSPIPTNTGFESGQNSSKNFFFF